jgi:hypothetical protein
MEVGEASDLSLSSPFSLGASFDNVGVVPFNRFGYHFSERIPTHAAELSADRVRLELSPPSESMIKAIAVSWDFDDGPWVLGFTNPADGRVGAVPILNGLSFKHRGGLPELAISNPTLNASDDRLDSALVTVLLVLGNPDVFQEESLRLSLPL